MSEHDFTFHSGQTLLCLGYGGFKVMAVALNRFNGENIPK